MTQRAPEATQIDEMNIEFQNLIDDSDSYDFSRDSDGDYISPDTWEAFQGFKAAWNTRAALPHDGGKVDEETLYDLLHDALYIMPSRGTKRRIELMLKHLEAEGYEIVKRSSLYSPAPAVKVDEQPQPGGITTGGFMLADEQIKYMRDRFLGWKLPENFNPDGGISFAKKPYNHVNEPYGTNVFDAQQAEQMIRYMLDGLQQDPLRTTEPVPVSLKRLTDKVDDKLRKLSAINADVLASTIVKIVLDAATEQPVPVAGADRVGELEEALKAMIKDAPTQEPEYVDCDNWGDIRSNEYERQFWFWAEKIRAILKDKANG